MIVSSPLVSINKERIRRFILALDARYPTDKTDALIALVYPDHSPPKDMDMVFVRISQIMLRSESSPNTQLIAIDEKLGLVPGHIARSHTAFDTIHEITKTTSQILDQMHTIEERLKWTIVAAMFVVLSACATAITIYRYLVGE